MQFQVAGTISVKDLSTVALKKLLQETQEELSRRSLLQRRTKGAARRLDEYGKCSDAEAWIVPGAARVFMAVGLRTYGDVYNLAPEDFVKIQGMKLTTINHVLCILGENGLNYEERWGISVSEMRDLLRAQWKKVKEDVKENGAA